MGESFDYQPILKGHHRQTTYRRVAVISSIVIALFTLTLFTRKLVERIRVVSAWQQAMAVVLPPTQVVADWKRVKQGDYPRRLPYLPVFDHSCQSTNCPLRRVSVMWGVGPFDQSGNAVGFVVFARSNTVPTLLSGSSQQVIKLDELQLIADRIYAGQPDRADESHFTIRYELNGKSDIIDGWLIPDDSVKLQPRNARK